MPGELSDELSDVGTPYCHRRSSLEMRPIGVASSVDAIAAGTPVRYLPANITIDPDAFLGNRKIPEKSEREQSGIELTCQLSNPIN